MRAAIRRIVLAVLVVSAAARAQAVAGQVKGFDGEPAARVVVRVLGVHGQTLGEVLSDAEGLFQLDRPEEADALQLQHEGVYLDVSLKGRDPTNVKVSFQGVPHFTLRGHVVDPGGAPGARLDVALRDPNGKNIVTTTTDARGAFVVHVGPAVQDLLVDPFGWGYVYAGPFAADRGVAVDLRLDRDRFFCVSGRACDLSGAPMADTRVVARFEGKTVAFASTDRDGRFALWADRRIDEITAGTIPLGAQLPGDWRTDATVVLDERTHGYTAVVGRVVDARGKGLSGLLLFAVAAEGRPDARTPPIGKTDEDGRFRIVMPRAARFLCACDTHREKCTFAAGPWSAGIVELRSKH